MIVSILKVIGFILCDVDQFIFVKKSGLGVVFIAIDVDDNFLIGHSDAVDDSIC